MTDEAIRLQTLWIEWAIAKIIEGEDIVSVLTALTVMVSTVLLRTNDPDGCYDRFGDLVGRALDNEEEAAA